MSYWDILLIFSTEILSFFGVYIYTQGIAWINTLALGYSYLISRTIRNRGFVNKMLSTQKVLKPSVPIHSEKVQWF